MLCGHSHRGEDGIPGYEYFHLHVDIFTFPPLPCYSPSGMFLPLLCHVSNFQSRAKPFPLQIVLSPNVFSFVPFIENVLSFMFL